MCEIVENYAKEYAKEYVKEEKARLKKLTEVLVLAGRTEELLLAIQDDEVCEKLFSEFDL